MNAITREKADGILNNIFNNSGDTWALKDSQWDVINQVINNSKNCLMIEPTGGGKSLCFQIPGLLMHQEDGRGLTVVISPLRALIEDQCLAINNHFERAGLNCRAKYLTKKVDSKDRAYIWTQLSNQVKEMSREEHKEIRALSDDSGLEAKESQELSDELNEELNEEAINEGSNPIAFLYVTPETLRYSKELFKRIKPIIRQFVIDEAHCISAWGSSFRPSYRAIGTFIKDVGLEDARIEAFTATCDNEIFEDIKGVLFGNDVSIVGSPETSIDDMIIPGGDGNFYLKGHTPDCTYKTTLSCEVFDKNPDEALLSFLKDNRDKKGIIFCVTKNQVKNVIELIRDNESLELSHAAPFYGSRGEDAGKVQSNIMKAFTQGAIKTIVATSAFGMGVDIDDVEYVVHYSMPLTMSDYIQQCGRAGRKCDASCVLFAGPGDFKIAKTLLKCKELKMYPIGYASRIRAKDREHYVQVADYCVSHACLPLEEKTKFYDTISSFEGEISFEEKWVNYVASKSYDKKLLQQIITVSDSVNSDINLGRIKAFDAALADGVYTLWYNGYEEFTLKDLYQVITGNYNATLSSERKEYLKEHLESMRGVLPINCNSSQYLFSTDALNCYPWAFKFHEAAIENNNLCYVPYGVLEGMSAGVEGSRRLSDTHEIIAIKHYLLKRLEVTFGYSNRHTNEAFRLVRSEDVKPAYRFPEKTAARKKKESETIKKAKENNQSVPLHPRMSEMIIIGDRRHKTLRDKNAEYEQTGIISVLESVRSEYKKESLKHNARSKDQDTYSTICKLLDNMVKSNYICGFEPVFIDISQMDDLKYKNAKFLKVTVDGEVKYVRGFRIEKSKKGESRE